MRPFKIGALERFSGVPGWGFVISNWDKSRDGWNPFFHEKMHADTIEVFQVN